MFSIQNVTNEYFDKENSEYRYDVNTPNFSIHFYFGIYDHSKCINNPATTLTLKNFLYESDYQRTFDVFKTNGLYTVLSCLGSNKLNELDDGKTIQCVYSRIDNKLYYILYKDGIESYRNQTSNVYNSFDAIIPSYILTCTNKIDTIPFSDLRIFLSNDENPIL